MVSNGALYPRFGRSVKTFCRDIDFFGYDQRVGGCDLDIRRLIDINELAQATEMKPRTPDWKQTS